MKDKSLKAPGSNPLVFTVDEIAKILRIGRNSAYQLVRAKKLRAVGIGRRLLVPAAALDEFLNPSQ